VLAKYLELQRRRREWSRDALRGKKAVELGAGMGLGGMALALMGCDVMLTDVAEVLPLLRRNVAQVQRETLRAADGAVRGADVGRCVARELDWEQIDEHGAAAKAEAAAWSNMDEGGARRKSEDRRRRRRSSSGAGGGSGGSRRASLEGGGGGGGADATPPPAPPPPPPFDIILAADCVYSETAVPVFLRAVLALSGRGTTILVCNERRSHTTADLWAKTFSEHFALKRVPYAKLDPEHRHPLIELWQLKRKRAPNAAAAAGAAGVAAEALAEGLATKEEEVDEEGTRDQET
jgi:hypothetical protein